MCLLFAKSELYIYISLEMEADKEGPHLGITQQVSSVAATVISGKAEKAGS